MAAPQIPTIEHLTVGKDGKLPYELVRAIRNLQEAIGRGGTGAAADPAQAAAIAELQKRVSFLQRQFDIDQAARVQGGGGGDSGGGGGGGGTPGGGTPTVPVPNLSADVSAYAAAHPAELDNSCLDSGGSNAYMVGLVAYLQGIDARVNFNGKRGDTSDPSIDAVSYYYGVLPAVEGSHDVYIFDVISCYCGAQIPGSGCVAGPSWNNVSRFAPGAWISTPPS